MSCPSNATGMVAACSGVRPKSCDGHVPFASLFPADAAVGAWGSDTAEGFGQPIRQIFEPFYLMKRELPTPFDTAPRYRVTVDTERQGPSRRLLQDNAG